MQDDHDKEPSFLKYLLKGLGYVGVTILVVIVVLFGLVAGFCGLARLTH
jgi:hypothetical protein